ncbi:MAG: hypothetical protein ACOYZ6_13060 [Chloroflexota bacterium]
MKNNTKLLAILILCVLLIQSCGPVTPYTPTPVITPTKTSHPPTATAIPSPTPTPVGHNVILSKPKNVYDPKDPTLPDLILQGQNGYRLDSQWQIDKIEYVYDWWGLSEPQLGYEVISNSESGYHWNDKLIPAERIDDFLATITNLHPSQSLLVGIFHTDDYPTWQIELTGKDGNRILIYSESNENPGYGPWHVVYNGRIYAQYDGTIGLAIGRLFERGDEFVWDSFLPEYHTNDFVGFATTGWPNQLWYGFNGLLPISESFHYFVNPETNEIRGFVRGRYSIGGFGNMIVGRIDTLKYVRLTKDGQKQNCAIEALESDDPYAEAWNFSCPVLRGETGQRYRFPIEIIFGTDEGRDFITEGTLFGQWGNLSSFWLLPPPEEIQSAIEKNPNAQELLKNTDFYVSQYVGKMLLGKDTYPTLSGQIVLIGTAIIDGVEINYSIFTPFIVENNQFVRFGLTEQELKRFLSDAMKSPITRRYLIYYPKATLNLWFASFDKVKEPEMPELWVGSGATNNMNIRVGVCGDSFAQVYPSKNKPFRRFTFNSDDLWYPWRGFVNDNVSFLLTDNETIVDKIELSWWGESERNELNVAWQLLLPSQLNVLGERRFLQIDYSADKRQLRITPPYDSTDDELATYQKSLALLPVSFETKLIPGAPNTRLYIYTANDIDIFVTTDGTLATKSCIK